ncbi:MAG: hypothetical protein AAF334_00615 [Pseudomonadota bacterium]
MSQPGQIGAGSDPLAALTEDQRDAFEERAAILEFEAGLPRALAERRALAEVIGVG